MPLRFQSRLGHLEGGGQDRGRPRPVVVDARPLRHAVQVGAGQQHVVRIAARPVGDQIVAGGAGMGEGDQRGPEARPVQGALHVRHGLGVPLRAVCAVAAVAVGDALQGTQVGHHLLLGDGRGGGRPRGGGGFRGGEGLRGGGGDGTLRPGGGRGGDRGQGQGHREGSGGGGAGTAPACRHAYLSRTGRRPHLPRTAVAASPRRSGGAEARRTGGPASRLTPGKAGRPLSGSCREAVGQWFRPEGGIRRGAGGGGGGGGAADGGAPRCGAVRPGQRGAQRQNPVNSAPGPTLRPICRESEG